MKKILLLTSIIVSAVALNAQTVVYFDDIESYTAFQPMAEQNTVNWDTWTGNAGGADDAEVSTDYAFSGDQSIMVDGTSVDLILQIGPYEDEGIVEVSWMMYIPNGEGAYFNSLHEWVGDAVTTNEEWATEVYFAPDGTVEWLSGEGTGSGAAFDSDTWFEITIMADLGNDIGTVLFNDVEIYSWQWSLDSGAGTAGVNAIRAVDFYGASGPSGSTAGGLYYVDDVTITTTGIVGMNENTPVASFSINPNPATDHFVMGGIEKMDGGTMQVMDITGKIVLETIINDEKSIDVSNLESGIYMVKLVGNNRHAMQKLVVR